MAVSTRRIKARIKSISNTRKITKAMELVSGAKMRRAVQMTVDSRHYSTGVKGIVENVLPLIKQKSHPLLYGRKQALNTILIVVASDRGLCGGFNTQLIKKAAEFLKSRRKGIGYHHGQKNRIASQKICPDLSLFSVHFQCARL